MQSPSPKNWRGTKFIISSFLLQFFFIIFLTFLYHQNARVVLSPLLPSPVFRRGAGGEGVHMHNQSYLKNIRRELRQQQTRQEKILWSFLRNRKQGLKFKRQESIGDYIIDFYCREKKLIIELDGEIHKNQSESDLERTRFLESLGFKVLRFWNNQIETEIEKVLEKIQQF